MAFKPTRSLRESQAISSRNGVSRHVGAGVTQAVREALANGPMARDALIKATGYSARAVKTAANQLLNKGGVVTIVEAGVRRYALYRDAEKVPHEAKSEHAMAGPITHGRGTRWYL